MQHKRRRISRRPGLIIGAGLVSLGLIAAACGGDDDSSTDTTTATTAGGATTTGATGGATTTAQAATTTAAPKPVPGGKLIFAVEAEVAQPWTPANMQCDSACQVRARTFFEPLMATNAETLKVEPYLAESLTPNADYTEFTL